MRIFISHSSTDRGFVESLRQALARRGRADLKVFTPADIEPGQSWSEEIKRAIEKSDVFVPVFSVAAERSPWVATEISLALASEMTGGTKAIIPVRVDASAQAPFFLRDIQWVDFSDPKDFERGMDVLVKSVDSRSQHPTELQDTLRARQELIRIQSELLDAQVKAMQEEANSKTQHVAWMLGAFAVTTAAVGFATLFGFESKHEWEHLMFILIAFLSGAFSGWPILRWSASRRAKDHPQVAEATHSE